MLGEKQKRREAAGHESAAAGPFSCYNAKGTSFWPVTAPQRPERTPTWGWQLPGAVLARQQQGFSGLCNLRLVVRINCHIVRLEHMHVHAGQQPLGAVLHHFDQLALSGAHRLGHLLRIGQGGQARRVASCSSLQPNRLVARVVVKLEVGCHVEDSRLSLGKPQAAYQSSGTGCMLPAGAQREG